MTKMDMVWIAVANLLHPQTAPSRTVTRADIEREVSRLFGEALTAVMIERHIVSSVDRMADKVQPKRGVSRNRYLFRTATGATPAQDGRFRLYKTADSPYDGWEKTGPTHPDSSAVSPEYRPLIAWYQGEYANG